MGVIVKICAPSNISGTEVFLDKCFVSENLLTINVQKQLDLSRQICLSSFAKRKGTQNIYSSSRRCLSSVLWSDHTTNSF